MEGCSSKDIVYFNCQGYINNRDAIQELIANWNPKILCLVETHIDNNIEEDEIKINGYKHIKCVTHNRRTGGILIYLHQNIKFKLCLNLNYEYLWFVGLEVEINNDIFKLDVLYHPPQKNDNIFLEFLGEYFENLQGTSMIMVGDFNLDYFNETSFYCNKLKEITYINGLKQIVEGPTRITQHSITLIDHIVTNYMNLTHDVHLTPKIGDHAIISVDIVGLRDLNRKTIIKKRYMKNYNCEQLQNKILAKHWNNNSNSVDSLANSFVHSLSKSVNDMCPMVSYTSERTRFDNEWRNENIVNFTKERDRLYKRAVFTGDEDDWNQYKSIRNILVGMIREAKEKYLIEVIDENRYDGKKLWKNLKNFLPGSKTETFSEIRYNNKTITDEQEIAETLNLFFLESISDIVTNIPKPKSCGVYMENIHCVGALHGFGVVSMEVLKGILKSLSNTGEVVDGISTSILRDACVVAANRLLDVINTSLSVGEFPREWKTSCIVPVPKVAGTVLPGEFRPINLMPPYEKVLEICVKNDLIQYCSENNIIVPNQSGFRVNHSCEAAIINIFDNWLKEVDKGNVVLCVFLDFKRAFETVDRSSLLEKLNRIGVRGTALKWFGSYLEDRSQLVKFRNVFSTKRKSKYGVPQGTVLGPVLFNIYINDIVKCAKRCDISLFADDTVLYIAGKSIYELVKIMNEELSDVFSWLCDNNMCLNVNKSKAMVLGSNYALNAMDYTGYKVVINSTEIERVDSCKYLGVVVDKNLNFKKHVDYMCSKIARKVYLLGRIGKNMTIYAKLLLYKSLVGPHFGYCSAILIGISRNERQKLQKLQNKAMRIILKCDRYTPIRVMLDTLGLMNIEQFIIYSAVMFVFRMRINTLPQYLTDKLMVVQSVHEHNTRSINNYYIENFKRSQTAKTVFVGGLRLFNDLPQQLRDCSGVSSFKCNVIHYIINNF